MITKQEIRDRIIYLDSGMIPLSLIVTVVLLPSGAKEVITNYQRLDEKIKYLMEAYDENLRLKSCPEIQLLDFIIL
jgi:hypothetical protein